MIQFTTVIHKFADQGEKTGWAYIDIPLDIAQQIKPDTKKSFRVKGYLDQFEIKGIAILPMGGGNFILPINKDMRKGLSKGAGAIVSVRLEKDDEFVINPNAELMECLDEEPEALAYFNSLTKSHRDYFTKWIESAKTEPTKIKRITKTVIALSKKYGYGEMIRLLKDI